MLAKRPLMFISLSFVAGMYILSLLNIVTVLCFVLGLLFILMFFLVRKVRIKNTLLLLLCSIIFLCGSVYFDIATSIERKKLNPYVNKTIEFSAEILEEPSISENSISFVANVISINHENKVFDINEKVIISRYLESKSDLENFKTIKVGDLIQSKCEVKVPNTSMNYGGFDYAKYLKSDNIFFLCKLKNAEVKIYDHIKRPVRHTLLNFRAKCISFFDETFPTKEGAVLKAFITGDKSTISEETAKSFSNSGLSHVLAVSGLHVSVFVSLIVSLLKLFNVSKRKEMLFSAIGAMFFVFFTGASVSALRAGILCILALIAKLIYRKSDPLTTLSLAAAFICLITPQIIFSASFMLSFAATAGILLFYNSISNIFSNIYKGMDYKSAIYKITRNICDSFAVGLSAQIFVTPLLVYLFNGFSVMSLLSTMLVVPFLSFLLAGGILFIIVNFISSTLAYPIGGFIYFLAKIMLFISDSLGGLSFSKVLFGRITPFLLLMYGLAIATVLFLIKKNKLNYVIALISLMLLSVSGLINTYINYNTTSISFINVGQGDCALFKAPGDCDILFDAGGYKSSKNTGEYIIAPYLIKNGVTDIEYVIVSHMHSDHIIGLDGLMDVLKIDNLIIPYGQINTEDGKAIIKKAKENDVNVMYFTAGDVLEINENIKITALAPDGEQSKYSKEDNNMGLVTRVDYGENSFMFTGDIDSTIEKHLLSKYPDMIEADVLKVAHHGSKYSNCKEFIDAVNPKFAYIPVGENIYGHPTKETIKILKDNGTEVYRADIHNDVTFYFDSKSIKGVVYYN